MLPAGAHGRAGTLENRGHRVRPRAPADRQPGTLYSHREDKDTWVFTLNSGTPPEVTVKAIAADGTVIAEKDQGLVWTRVGGTEQCGGPITTPPIQFAVP